MARTIDLLFIGCETDHDALRVDGRRFGRVDLG
jgi:hypothetical protein